MLDVGRAPGGEIVEKADGIAAPDEAVSNMRPDEAGTARDQVSQFTRALALAGVDMNLSESPRSEAMFVKAMPTGNTPLVPSGRTVASKGGARAMGLDRRDQCVAAPVAGASRSAANPVSRNQIAVLARPCSRVI